MKLPFYSQKKNKWNGDQHGFGLVAPWVKDLKKVHNTYNARTETVHEKPSFRNAWKKNQFCLIPADVIFEPKYINNKPEWWGIYRKDDMPFTCLLYTSPSPRDRG